MYRAASQGSRKGKTPPASTLEPWGPQKCRGVRVGKVGGTHEARINPWEPVLLTLLPAQELETRHPSAARGDPSRQSCRGGLGSQSPSQGRITASLSTPALGKNRHLPKTGHCLFIRPSLTR